MTGLEEALSRTCPLCKAGPQEPCRNMRYTEQLATWSHRARSKTGGSKWRFPETVRRDLRS